MIHELIIKIVLQECPVCKYLYKLLLFSDQQVTII